MSFTIPAVFGIPIRKADNSAKLTFITTLEVPNEDFAQLDAERNSTGWLLFKDNSINEEDIPKEQAPGQAKSPTARLRARMYVFYNKKHGTGVGFDGWFEETVDNIGRKYLEKLDNE